MPSEEVTTHWALSNSLHQQTGPGVSHREGETESEQIIAGSTLMLYLNPNV